MRTGKTSVPVAPCGRRLYGAVDDEADGAVDDEAVDDGAVVVEVGGFSMLVFTLL